MTVSVVLLVPLLVVFASAEHPQYLNYDFWKLCVIRLPESCDHLRSRKEQAVVRGDDYHPTLGNALGDQESKKLDDFFLFPIHLELETGKVSFCFMIISFVSLI